MKRVLGLDFGGVIALRKTTDPMIEGIEEAIDSVRYLFDNRIYIVSRVDNAESQARVMAYLDERKLWVRLGISRSNIRFCLLRSDKGPICQDLGITDFVDDHTEVLSHMHSVKFLYAMRTQADELEKFPIHQLPGAGFLCSEWGEIAREMQRRERDMGQTMDTQSDDARLHQVIKLCREDIGFLYQETNRMEKASIAMAERHSHTLDYYQGECAKQTYQAARLQARLDLCSADLNLAMKDLAKAERERDSNFQICVEQENKLKAAVVTAAKWQDTYNREVLGVNNEGDTIGGDVSPGGLKAEVGRLKRLVSHMKLETIQQFSAKWDERRQGWRVMKSWRTRRNVIRNLRLVVGAKAC